MTMAVRVAVDFGTSSTCVAMSVDGREPQVITVDGSPLMSSAVYAAADGTVFVGQEADRQAAVDPSRYEPHPKRRIDETELLLGATVLPVRQVIRAVLARAVGEARRVAGGASVDQLVLTHPADWGGFRTRVLRDAAVGLGTRIVLVPEPVAAAVFHAASFPARHGNRPLAVFDLGGGTIDVSVVRPAPGPPGFQVLATRGDPTFGGADIDQLLLEHVGTVVSDTDPAAWRALVEGRDLPDRRRRRVIHQDVRGAKETLSRHAYTDVPMPPPFPDAHVTRADLERLITGPVDRAAELTVATIRAAATTPAELGGIFLVGGASRIPLVSRLVHQRTGVMPTTLDQPETVVARGALRAVAGIGAGTGVLAAGGNPEATRPVNRNPDVTRPVHRPPLPPPAPLLPAQPLLPVQPPPRSRRGLLLAGGGALVVAAVGTALAISLSGDDPSGDPDGQQTSGAAGGDRVIAQYEYQFTLPAGWTQTSSDPDRLRTEVKPVGGENGTDRVLVEEIRLSFDSDTDRQQAVEQLRGQFEDAGDSFADFDEQATFAGRDVIHYVQRLPNSDATVDWYVVLDGRTQVNVGCQYGNEGGGRDDVSAACTTVVRTLTVVD
jgi:type VII secretion-associated protein (TIGR03931 family)